MALKHVPQNHFSRKSFKTEKTPAGNFLLLSFVTSASSLASPTYATLTILSDTAITCLFFRAAKG